MLCTGVFALWWSFFVWGVWQHLRPAERHIWAIDRHTTQIIDVSITLTPLEFANASVLWLDTEMDSVELDLVQTIDQNMATVSVKEAVMNVYDSGFDGGLIEMYNVNIDIVDVDNAHLQIFQNDSHYSPYRTIVVKPNVDWVLGGAELAQEERFGQIKEGMWYEGEDQMQMFVGVLFAWCMGLVFLVVMRRPREEQSIVVVGRQKRVFNK